MYFWSKGDRHHLKFKENKPLQRKKKKHFRDWKCFGTFFFFLIMFESFSVVEGTKPSSVKGSPWQGDGDGGTGAAGFNWTLTLPIQNPIHLLERKMQEALLMGEAGQ